MVFVGDLGVGDLEDGEDREDGEDGLHSDDDIDESGICSEVTWVAS